MGLPVVGDSFDELLKGETVGFSATVDGFDDVGGEVCQGEDCGYVAVLVAEFPRKFIDTASPTI